MNFNKFKDLNSGQKILVEGKIYLVIEKSRDIDVVELWLEINKKTFVLHIPDNDDISNLILMKAQKLNNESDSGFGWKFTEHKHVKDIKLV